MGTLGIRTMAVHKFHITNEDSGTFTGNAFNATGVEGVRSSLTMDADAFFIATNTGMVLRDGPWTVLINGKITADGTAIWLEASANSAITIGVSAEISSGSGSTAVHINHMANFTNKGSI